MFDRLTRHVSYFAGRPWAFLAGLGIIVGWLSAGPFFGWSDTHSLMINTFTTCVTFLLLFIVQNTQNRDTAEIKAMLREMCEDLAEVDEIKARQRVDAEERPA